MKISPVDLSGLGKEPIFQATPSMSEMIRAYNWYNYFYSHDDAVNFIYDFCITNRVCPNIIHKIKSYEKEKISTTQGWNAKMSVRGVELPKDIKNRFYLYLKGLEESLSGFDVSPRQSKTSGIKNTVDKIITDIETAVDEIIKNGKTNFNLLNYMNEHNIKGLYSNYIEDYYRPIYDDKIETKGDKKLIKFYEQLLNDNGAFKAVVSENRKPRKKRKVKDNTAKLISKIEILEKDDVTGISGVKLDRVIGKDICIAYSPETEKLIVFHGENLQIKGKTFAKIKDEISFSKKLRKPKEQLVEMLNLETKAKILGYIEKIKTVKGKAPVRLTNLLILKAY